MVRKDPAFSTVAAECERSAREKLGDPREVGALRDRYAELGNALVQDRAEKVSAILVAYGKRLSGCLAGHGYRPKADDEFDARGDLTQYGIERGAHVPVTVDASATVDGAEVRPAVPARDYRPSAAEAAFAVTFVRCANSTGLFRELDRRDPEIQREIVERHVAEFSGLNPRIEALARKAETVLRERSGQ